MNDPIYRVEDLPTRLASKIQIDPVSGCWLWTRYCDPKGYGRAHWQGKADRVHRIVYRLLVGLELDHVKDRGCTSRACCNPAHLERVMDAYRRDMEDPVKAAAIREAAAIRQARYRARKKSVGTKP